MNGATPKTSKHPKKRSRSRRKDKSNKAQCQPLTKQTSDSDLDDLEVIPPVLSQPIMTHTEALNKKFNNTLLKNFFIASMLFFAVSTSPVDAVKINGALLCRPRISSENINEFTSALGETFNTVLQSEIGHPEEILKSGLLSVIIVKPKNKETSTELKISCDQQGSLYSPESVVEFNDLCIMLADIYRKNILMATVEFDEVVKPFSLKFTINNIKGTFSAQTRKRNYIAFRPPAQAPNPPDFLEPNFLMAAQDKPNTLQGILCSINPAKNKVLKRDVDMLKDRTQSFAVNLDNQIQKFIEMGSKLGLSFNETAKLFSNQFGVKQCISTFVDLVPTKAVIKIKDRIDELLGDKFIIHAGNVAETLQLLGKVGRELSTLSTTTAQIAKGDYDVIEITNDFDTVIEALRNLDISDPLTQFLLALGLSILLATLCLCAIMACLCKKLRQRIVNRLVESYRL